MKDLNGFIYYYNNVCKYKIGDYLESPLIDDLGRRFSFTKKAQVVKVIEHMPGSKLMGEIYVQFL